MGRVDTTAPRDGPVEDIGDDWSLGPGARQAATGGGVVAGAGLRPLRGDLAAPERIGIALRKQDKELQAAVSQAIERLRDEDNGTFARLYEQWIGP